MSELTEPTYLVVNVIAQGRGEPDRVQYWRIKDYPVGAWTGQLEEATRLNFDKAGHMQLRLSREGNFGSLHVVRATVVYALLEVPFP